MENVLNRVIELCARDCDFAECWKTTEILVTMQELAMEHSDLLGVGYRHLRPNALAFALTRTELHMERYPRMGEKVVCRTWAAPTMKWMFPRYFLFETESGESLGYAGTIWVLMDLNERKMVSPSALNTEIAAGSMKAPLRMPAKAAVPSADAVACEYRPAYSEIDVNGHVNNTRYAAWMCDALGMDVFREKRIKKLVVNYSHEILPDQSITLRHEVKENAFCMSGDHEGVNCFTLSGELE